VSGYGDAVSAGAIRLLWHLDGVDDEIDQQSGAFRAGKTAAIVHGVALVGVGTGAFEWLGARLTLLLGGSAATVAAKAAPDIENLSEKIVRQSAGRGWTPQQIMEAFERGEQFRALNRLGGANTPATGYVHPETGQYVVIDDASGEVIQVGKSGYLRPVYGG
jgi:hypothetical protein